jgi:hypothetical protein
MKELFEAIYTKFSTVNDFNTAIGGRFYLNHAPQSGTMPYCVYQLITNAAEYNFTSTFDDAEIQMDIIDDNTSSDILDHAYKCMDLFDDCTLAVTGYQFMTMERDWNAFISDPEEQVQRYTIQYLVSLRK